MKQLQLAFSSFFFAFYFLSLYSIKKLAWIIFNAPGLFFLMRSMALILEHPMCTRASATINGALPRPATQWTPIRGGEFGPWFGSFLFNFLGPAVGFSSLG
jgi:hypothetical protein